METAATPTPAPLNLPGARSAFLTVLCVLTFVGSGWGILHAVRNFVQADAIAAIASQKISDIEDELNDQGRIPLIVKSILYSDTKFTRPGIIRKYALLTSLSKLLTVIGAIFMFNLKKAGFYIYIVGIILSIANPLIWIGQALGAIEAIWPIVTGAAFVIMYGANLKQMNR